MGIWNSEIWLFDDVNKIIVWLIRNQIKHVKILIFINIWFVKQDIQKWLKTKICNFLWRIWKWKEKRRNFFWPSGAGIWTPDFQEFSRPWLEFFMWSEEPEIKYKQASKRDRTLATSYLGKEIGSWKEFTLFKTEELFLINYPVLLTPDLGCIYHEYS